MSNMPAAALWTLITVTQGGAVHHSEPFATFHMCNEAKSLAQTGMTIEDKAAYDWHGRSVRPTLRRHGERYTHPAHLLPNVNVKWSKMAALLHGGR
jgi:hypothetical protein